MKERPILFSAPMVRAILEGRKVQTRRVVRWPNWISTEIERTIAAHKMNAVDPCMGRFVDGRVVNRFCCPYGQPGDRLWVRETWCEDEWEAPPLDVNGCPRSGSYTRYLATDTDNSDDTTWRPSIHMPRWASRITLEVVSVRVERLNDISEEDAMAEGIESAFDEGVWYYGPFGNGHCDPRIAFSWLWDSINGDGAWKQNPWVRVVEFKQVKA